MAQEPVVLRDQRLLIEWVARAKYPIAVASDQGETTKVMHTGAPVKFVKVKEGVPLTSGPLNLMVIDKAPHPNAARLFVNWALSKEGIAVISPSSVFPSLRLTLPMTSLIPCWCPVPKMSSQVKTTGCNRGL